MPSIWQATMGTAPPPATLGNTISNMFAELNSTPSNQISPTPQGESGQDGPGNFIKSLTHGLGHSIGLTPGIVASNVLTSGLNHVLGLNNRPTNQTVTPQVVQRSNVPKPTPYS